MIWVIGGTSDANRIVQLLTNNKYSVTISATTNYGTLLAKNVTTHVIQNKLSVQAMINLINTSNIQCVIDASHPFAAEVSLNAINACKLTNVKYIRFEREQQYIKGCKYYQSYTDISEQLTREQGNILLTTGSKNIHLFSQIERERLVVKVLPVIESIEKCNYASIVPHNIIAMKGIITEHTSKAIYKEYNIKHLVTKDSGLAGGLSEKVSAALSMDINVHILCRPAIDYPCMVNSDADILKLL